MDRRVSILDTWCFGDAVNGEERPSPVVTLEDFAACDPEEPIAMLDQVSMSAISTAYAFASAPAPAPCNVVYGLLADITGIHLDPADRGDKWKPSAPFAS